MTHCLFCSTATTRWVTNALSNGTIPDPYGLPFPRLGVRNPTPKLQSLLSQLGTSNLADIFAGFIRTQAHKNFGEKGTWAYPETSRIFLSTPIISGTCKATNFKFGRYIHRAHPTKSSLKIWEKRERGRTHGLPTFLEYPCTNG